MTILVFVLSERIGWVMSTAAGIAWLGVGWESIQHSGLIAARQDVV